MEICNLEKGQYEFEILSHKFIINKVHLNLYTITINSFSTKKEACAFLPKIFSFLYWIIVKNNLGISFPKFIRNPELKKDDQINSIFNMLRLDIRNDVDNMNTIEIIDESVEKIRGYDSVCVNKNVDLEYSLKSFGFRSPEKMVEQENLTLAIELYSNYYYDQTDNAKFVTLVNVLEALIPESNVPKVSLEAIKLLKNSVKKMRNEYSQESDEWKNLEHLLSRVGKLKYESIGKGMKNYIYDTIQKNRELGDPEEISDQIKKIYGYRSSLLHSGKIDENDLKISIQFLIDFIPKLLNVLYISSLS